MGIPCSSSEGYHLVATDGMWADLEGPEIKEDAGADFAMVIYDKDRVKRKEAYVEERECMSERG